MTIWQKISPALPVFLFAIFPALFLFAYNVREVIFRTIALPLAASLGLAALFFAVMWLLLRNRDKAAIISSIFLLLFFSYGHGVNLLVSWLRHRYILIFWIFLLLTGAWIVLRSRRNLAPVIQWLNVAAVILVLTSLISIGTFKVKQWYAHKGAPETPALLISGGEAIDTALPDIYYIMPDAYASTEALRDIFGYDNSSFIRSLEEKGFSVVPHSYSNYVRTPFSLPALLHMTHIENLGNAGEVSAETFDAMQLVRDHPVGRFLQSQGYTYINIGTRWDWTRHNPYADENINKDALSDFSTMLFENSMLYPISFYVDIFNKRRVQWERILYQFDELEKIPLRREPTFVFMHLGIPHNPSVFREDGSFLEREHEPDNAQEYFSKSDYRNQLIFLNKKLEAGINTLLQTSERPPVIMIQSDHGSRIYATEQVTREDQITDELIEDRLGNFSAYFLPSLEPDAEGIYPSRTDLVWNTITPVNTFPVIFNYYFNTNLPFSPDESYFSAPWDAAYHLINVTDRIRP